MAETNPVPVAPPATNNAKRYKTIIWLLIVIILVLIAIIVWINSQKGQQITEKVHQNIELQSELDSMMSAHETIKFEYGNLTDSLSVRDSLIVENAQEIRKLIASQADYYRIKKKLDRLRGITQNYVNQIDSLYTVNKQLTDENVRITEQYEEEKTKTQTLTVDKEVLEEKVIIASVLKAYNLTSVGLRVRGENKEKVTYKARRVDRVKVCFTLSENPVAEPGPKTIYIRIARPDKVIVTQGKDDAFAFEYQGQMINFTMKREIDYQNKAMDICVHWDKKSDEPAMKGIYDVAVFADGQEIGETQFQLE